MLNVVMIPVSIIIGALVGRYAELIVERIVDRRQARVNSARHQPTSRGV